MNKEDFDALSSVIEIAFEIWWSEFNKKYDVLHMNKYDLARLAFLEGREIVINRGQR